MTGYRRLPRLAAVSLAVFVLSVAMTSCGNAQDRDRVFRSQKHAFRLTTVADGLAHPWAIAFLPNGDMLVTEREGRLRVIRGGKLDPEPVAGLPQVAVEGQGGLLDVILDPNFADNRLIYFSYAGEGPGGLGTEVARARFDGKRLSNLQRLFVARPKTSGGLHFGSRLAFDRDGHLFITMGERGESETAQDLSAHRGKVVRLNADGTVPPDNPFVDRAGRRPEIYTYGHRNPQGMAVHPVTGRVWVHEHGPRGGDEINILTPGANYGWPVVTFGRAYSGFPIGEGSHKPGITPPIKYWVPSIAPSGMAFYTGDLFPGWKGNLFVGALALTHLNRLTLDGDKVVGEERLLDDLGLRVRDVRQGPDGHLYILIDDDPGQVLRLDPVP